MLLPLFGHWKIWKIHHNCNRKAKELFDEYCDHFHTNPHQFQGVELDEVSELDKYFKFNCLQCF